MSAIGREAEGGAAFERDVVRVGRVVVIVPVDLERDEIVLIRQFRLGAHLAIDKGDLVELPAGRVERGEDDRRCRAPRMPRGNRRRAADGWCRSST